MRVILDIGGFLAIVISACTVILYTLLGGLYSVAYTDVIQLVFITLSLASPVHFFVPRFLRDKSLLFLSVCLRPKITPPLALALQFLFRRTGLLKHLTVLTHLRQCSHKVLTLLGERGCSQVRSAELVQSNLDRKGERSVSLMKASIDPNYRLVFLMMP